MMIVHSMGNACAVAAQNYKNLFMVRIAVAVFNMILHDLDEVVKPMNLNQLARLFGVHWHDNI